MNRSTYKDHWSWPQAGGESGPQVTLSWANYTDRRLAWLYGHERAGAIRAGTDTDTQADIAKWNALGRRAAA